MKKVIHAIGNYFRTTDYWLLLLCITCSGISVALLFGIYRNEYIGDGKIFTQAAAILMGLMAAIILSKIDYRFIAKMWKLHVPLALFLVILTFFIGKQVSETVDDKAWLEIFGFNLQPSELLKISFIMSFAYHLSLVKEHLNAPKNVLLLCLHGAVPVLLIHFQGDDGSALIFALIFVIMLFSAGLSWKYLVTALVGAAIAIPVVWFGVMNYDQKMRFLAIFHPDDPEFATIFYQQYHGNISIGTGGVWGKGILTDKLRYVPEMHNDFIFSVAGEMLGFVGCIAIIGLLAAICLKILHNYRRCPDALGQNICVGVFAMYASQIIINIGMNLSVVPVIGVTLPFLSAGGSSILSTYMGIGLVLSVYLYNTKGLFTDNIS